MRDVLSLNFTDLTLPHTGTLIVFAQTISKKEDDDTQSVANTEDETQEEKENSFVLTGHAKKLNEDYNGVIERAAGKRKFKGQKNTSLDLLVPGDGTYDRVIVMGIGDPTKYENDDWTILGGRIFSKLGKHDRDIHIMLELDGEDITQQQSADVALGLLLRSYTFDKHKSKKSSQDDTANSKEETPEKLEQASAGQSEKNDAEDSDTDTPSEVTLCCPKPEQTQESFAVLKAIGDGVFLARDLVNEPSNILGPVEFADHAKALETLGVEVEIFDEDKLEELEMKALLGVGQGSAKPSRVAVMKWYGAADKDEQPVAFIGKGVTFDTGGISLKPPGGMEDMKGDMAGAACVIGLMKALAGRKAKVNAIGVLGLVENMPGANAQRPGDIVTSMSGQTIEVINTDAEGRLVLADVLWYTQKTYEPKFMINLATLTGAIIVALGHEYAGVFSNNDELVEKLDAAAESTGEKVWRMPLHEKYDKLIDSKFADMKNVGGRWAGSITAAQFLQRFVNDVPWAHIDVAGTGMSSPKTDINRSWGSGFGVRLLDALVAEYYEQSS